jgi:hypothetical protein
MMEMAMKPTTTPRKIDQHGSIHGGQTLTVDSTSVS